MRKPDISAASQRAAILDCLQTQGSITTLYAREQLGIMSPASRVLELRKRGHKIETHWTITKDKAGTEHREAKYVLFAYTIKKALPPATKLIGRA